MAIPCDRQALIRAGFPKDAPIYCGWAEIPDPERPAELKKLPDWPRLGWRRMDQVEGPSLGINIRAAPFLCVDIDAKLKAFGPILAACPCTEISPSGRGYHAFFAGVWTPGGEVWRNAEGLKIEVYGRGERNRFVALTGRWAFKGRDELADVLDAINPLGMLRELGWAPSRETKAAGGEFTLPDRLPVPPVIPVELLEWAGAIDLEPKGEGGHDFGRHGRFRDRSDARFAWLQKAAWFCTSPAEVAALLYAHFPVWLATRANPHSTVEGEVRNAWAAHLEQKVLLPPPSPDGVDVPVLAAGARAQVGAGGEAVQVLDAEAEVRPEVDPLVISDEQLARDFTARLEEAEGGGVVHATALGKAYFLDPASGLWTPDRDNRLSRDIYQHNAAVAQEWADAIPAECEGKGVRKLIQATRARFGSTGLMQNVTTAVRAHRGFDYQRLDTDPLVIGMVDGVYDVESGKMRKARADEYVTMSTQCPPDPSGDCPEFRKFMERIFRHDLELIGYMQRWFGYALTGLATEQIVMFCWGEGQNGKTTLMELMKDIFGTYARSIAAEVLMARRFEAHSTEIAQLLGARLILAMEVAEDAAWNEQRLKALSGGDTINANFMRQDKIEFRCNGKLTISGNHKPRLNGTDYAMIRRMRLVPFLQKISEQEKDRSLSVKLWDERRAILWWAVQGLRDWRLDGLRTPSVVVEATRNYFEAEDTIAEWITNSTAKSPEASYLVRDAVVSYNTWIMSIGRVHRYSPVRFRELMQGRGYELRQNHMKQWMIMGIKPIQSSSFTPSVGAPDYGQDE